MQEFSFDYYLTRGEKVDRTFTVKRKQFCWQFPFYKNKEITKSLFFFNIPVYFVNQYYNEYILKLSDEKITIDKDDFINTTYELLKNDPRNKWLKKTDLYRTRYKDMTITYKGKTEDRSWTVLVMIGFAICREFMEKEEETTDPKKKNQKLQSPLNTFLEDLQNIQLKA